MNKFQKYNLTGGIICCIVASAIFIGYFYISPGRTDPISAQVNMTDGGYFSYKISISDLEIIKDFTIRIQRGADTIQTCLAPSIDEDEDAMTALTMNDTSNYNYFTLPVIKEGSTTVSYNFADIFKDQFPPKGGQDLVLHIYMIPTYPYNSTIPISLTGMVKIFSLGDFMTYFFITISSIFLAIGCFFIYRSHKLISNLQSSLRLIGENEKYTRKRIADWLNEIDTLNSRIFLFNNIFIDEVEKSNFYFLCRELIETQFRGKFKESVFIMGMILRFVLSRYSDLTVKKARLHEEQTFITLLQNAKNENLLKLGEVWDTANLLFGNTEDLFRISLSIDEHWHRIRKDIYEKIFTSLGVKIEKLKEIPTDDKELPQEYHQDKFWQDFIHILVNQGVDEYQNWDLKQTLDFWEISGRDKSQTIEDKKLKFAQIVTGFANSDGGIILIGISDKKPRQIVGINNDEEKEKSITDVIEKFTDTKSGFYSIRPIKIDGKICLIVVIMRTNKPIGVIDSKRRISYHIRQGRHTNPTDKNKIVEEKIHLIAGDFSFFEIIKNFLHQRSNH